MYLSYVVTFSCKPKTMNSTLIFFSLRATDDVLREIACGVMTLQYRNGRVDLDWIDILHNHKTLK